MTGIIRFVAVAALSLNFIVGTKSFGEDNWWQFRGPTGRGHSTATDVPESWTPDNVKWVVDLKGSGQSSVVNWEDRLFLTASSDDGFERYVYCLDRENGNILWEKSIKVANPEETHQMNSRATPTCATDGKHVIAFFGPGGLHCFNLDGDEVWSKELGDFPGSWGIAASPMLVDDMVIQNCDAIGPSRLVAFDIVTGAPKWETKRDDKPRGGWSTPILIDYEGSQELVLNGEFGVNSYDPKTGKENWFCQAFNGRGSPVPDFAHGLLYVVNGKPGDVYAVKPGGSGDVTKTNMAWHASRKGGRDLPSPAVVGDYLFVSSMSGIATCYDAKTGEIFYSERLGDGIEMAAAPLVANGLIYIQTVFGGETIVVKPAKTLEIVARNSLGADQDEVFRSTLSPIKGELFSRSHSKVYCITK